MFASRLGAARSPLSATLILNGMYSATLDMIFSTVIDALRMALPQSASSVIETILRDRARYDSES